MIRQFTQKKCINLILLSITFFFLSLHYNSDNSLFVNGKHVINSKAKNSELIKYPMRLGGFSKYYNESSRKDTVLYGNVYDFSVDYSAIMKY